MNVWQARFGFVSSVSKRVTSSAVGNNINVKMNHSVAHLDLAAQIFDMHRKAIDIEVAFKCVQRHAAAKARISEVRHI